MWKYMLISILSCLVITSCAKQAESALPTVSFPQEINTPTAYMEGLLIGQLVLTNGCLRVNAGDQNGSKGSVLLIWQPGFSTRTEQGIIQVVDNTGQVVASVGDYVEVGGGLDDDPTWRELKEPLPEECPGPYFIVGDYIKKTEKPYP